VASELGALFTALARDYKRSTGGVLVIADVRRGSFVVDLSDAVIVMAVAAAPAIEHTASIAKAVGNVAAFGKSLIDLIKMAKKNELPKEAEKKLPRQSAEALMKTTIKLGGEVDIKEIDPDGTVREILCTSREALTVRANIRPPQAFAEPEYKNLRISAATTPALPDYGAEQIAESLLRIGSTPVAGPTHEVQAAVRAVAAALRELGMASVLVTVAMLLDARGEHELAALVRSEGEPPEREKVLS